MTSTWFRAARFLLVLIVVLLVALFDTLPQTTVRANGSDLIITGVIDGPLSGGLPKAVELYVVNSIADLSSYGIGAANNGGGTDGIEFSFPADSATAGEFLYLATESPGFTGFFGFAPDYTDGDATSINGDDAIELFQNGLVVDVFGEISYSAGAQGWAYGDGWAYRSAGTGPDGNSFVPANWSFSGPDALDGESGNATATTPFPIGTYSPDGGGPEVAFIHDIQGNGPNVVAGDYTIEAIVIGDYQAADQLRGFFVQEEDTDVDGNDATSEGIFIFCSSCPVDVAVGDQVQVSGSASDFFGMSQLSATAADDISVVSPSNPLPTPADITLPVPNVPTGNLDDAEAAINAYFEQFEGMLVRFSSPLVAAEYFQLGRYGQIVLSQGERLRQFTDANTPDAAGFIDHQIDVARRTIILDDDNNTQNSPIVASPDAPYFHPVPGLSTSTFFRGGDTIRNLTGVLHWSWAGFSGTDAWRIRPVTEAFDYAFSDTNTRPAVPASVGGNLKIASFNVLNYFTSIDDGGTSCGPTGGLECRGAHSQAERERQRDKIVSAIVAIDADIVGLIEIENNPTDAAVDDLVAGLNAATAPGTYAAVATGPIGTDAIKVAFVYQPAHVSLVGAHAVLDTPEFVNPNSPDPKNRPALAQTFEHAASGEVFTVVVNHLKSKGSGCGAGDDDTTTGQGNCNLTRTLATQELAAWLDTDPTASGDPDILIIGDLNAYRNEDPIVALENAGYTDLIDTFVGDDAYSYLFDGQIGYLDHALANPSMLGQVSGVTGWSINADEVPLFDYNDGVQDPAEQSFERESNALPIYEPNAFRSSDHDPVIVGLNPGQAAAPAITSSLPPNGQYGSGYSHSFVSTHVLAANAFSVTAGTLPPGLTLDAESGQLSGTPGAAGTYANITVTAGNGISANATQTFTITVDPAPLTVTATNQSIKQGDPIPPLTFQATGFVPGDTASSALTGELSTSATSSSAPGDYPIERGTLTAANYALTFVPGTLAIRANESEFLSHLPVVVAP